MNHYKCPIPFLFNAFKHHAATISAFIEYAKTAVVSPEFVNRELLKVGNAMIDIYHGPLSQPTVILEIEKHLKSMDCYHPEAYNGYISRISKAYRTMKLSDGSSWTLLVGREMDRYIHIHPSRGSAHTIRARAIALKTAINLLIFHESELDTNLVALVNEVRQHHLQESPIKNEVYTRGIRRVLGIL